MQRRARLLLVLIAFGCASAPPLVHTTPAIPVDPRRVEGRDFWFVLDGQTIAAPRDGLLRIGEATVQLPVDDGELEALHFVRYGADLLLCYEVTWGGEGATRFARVSLDPPRIEAWKQCSAGLCNCETLCDSETLRLCD